MITNNGKQIIAKYLIGQAPAYASYIAVGCGPNAKKKVSVDISDITVTGGLATIETHGGKLDPVDPHGFSSGEKVEVSGTFSTLDGIWTISQVLDNGSFKIATPGVANITFSDLPRFTVFAKLDFSQKETLDFEMFRVPISSRGFIKEDEASKIVFTAELPTEERYEMTEIGLYSAGANPSAGVYDSRLLYSFSQSENWEHHTATLASEIPTINYPLDANGTANIINVNNKVFRTTADNSIFGDDNRIARGEKGRFLNDSILISGDTSKILVDQDGNLTVDSVYESSHIHLNGAALDFNRQSPIDELRFAFSVVNKDGNSNSVPSRILVLIEFSSDDQLEPDKYARFQIDIEHSEELNASNNLNTNRYFVVSKQLQELVKSSNFSWGAVDIAKIYVCILDNNDPAQPSGDYYVALDGARLENIGSTNPLYGLVGYSPIVNTTGEPILKQQNTTNYVEFRTSVGIV